MLRQPRFRRFLSQFFWFSTIVSIDSIGSKLILIFSRPTCTMRDVILWNRFVWFIDCDIRKVLLMTRCWFLKIHERSWFLDTLNVCGVNGTTLWRSMHWLFLPILMTSWGILSWCGFIVHCYFTGSTWLFCILCIGSFLILRFLGVGFCDSPISDIFFKSVHLLIDILICFFL